MNTKQATANYAIIGVYKDERMRQAFIAAATIQKMKIFPLPDDHQGHYWRVAYYQPAELFILGTVYQTQLQQI